MAVGTSQKLITQNPLAHIPRRKLLVLLFVQTLPISGFHYESDVQSVISSL